MKIGILGAMHEEVSLIKKRLTVSRIESIAGKEFFVGQLNGADVVVTHSRWGKVASASTASTLIHHFNVDCILFTGVAAALHPDLQIGDVVVSEKLYQHDMDTRPFFDQHIIPLLGFKYFEADKKLLSIGTASAQKFLREFSQYIDADSVNAFSLHNPKVHSGIIGSGDQFIGHPDIAKKILQETPEILAVEMEGAAVAQVCHEHNVPFIVIRTISDKANASAHIDFTKFIQNVASVYSFGIVNDIVGTYTSDKKTRAEELIELLQLEKHIEGGWFRETYRSTSNIQNSENINRTATTLIHFMMTAGNFSAWHRLTSDEVWHFYEGHPILIHTLTPSGQLSTITLGDKRVNPQYQYQAIIEKDTWFAAEVMNNSPYALCGCQVSPGFEYEDFELAERADLEAQFPQHAEMIRKFTRS